MILCILVTFCYYIIGKALLTEQPLWILKEMTNFKVIEEKKSSTKILKDCHQDQRM